MKKTYLFLGFLLMFISSVSLTQTPQYYNANSGGIGNTLPFGSLAATGYETQWLIGPGEYSLPSPAPGGMITKFYIYMSSTGAGTYTNLTIKMGQTALTTFPVGTLYTGTLDTVYFRASASLSSTINTWMSITLDRPFLYNPTQSLVIQVSHCGLTGAGMSVWQTAGTTGIIRRNNITGTPSCVFTYASQDTRIIQNGLDLAPACNFTWGPQVSGTTSLLYSVKAIDGNVCWTSGAAATIRRTTDGGTTWGNGNPNPGVITGDVYNIEAIDANTAWCTTTPGATFIYKTTNGGTNWTQVYTLAGGFINAIKMATPLIGMATGDPVAGNWVILGTTDGGTTWVPLSTTAGTGDGRNNCLQVSLPNAWFGTGQGTIWRSTNAGLNWASVITTGLAGQVLSVHFNSLLFGLGGGATMVKSTDAGATYALLPALGTGNITAIQGSGTDFWYCRGTGIYRSTDGGTSWTQVHTAVGTQNDLSMATGTNGCPVMWSVATGGNIAKMNGTLVGVNNNNNQIPNTYALEQNYPNPFNPTTNIRFAIPKAGLVDLRVYDVLGREVASLINDFRQAGSHTVDFDASNLSSGVYFYTIRVNEFTQTKKMLLVK